MDIYQQNILDYYKHPGKRGTLIDPTNQGTAANPLCGDQVELKLKVQNGTIVQARWNGEGCVLSLAAADMLAEHLEGKQVAEASTATKAWMLESLGVELGPNRLKCALLPLDALEQIQQLGLNS